MFSIRTIFDLQMSNPNCIIIHGCSSVPGDPIDLSGKPNHNIWISWAREELIARGIPTTTPIMPEPWAPDYEKYKKEFEKQDINENTILIGHSCGCAFLVRWLGDTKRKVAKLILVAPGKIARKGNTAKELFYGYPIDETIKNRVREIIMFTADNEEENGKESLKMFHDVLGGEVIEIKRRGHYTMENGGKAEFPELIERCIAPAR
jgi:uncharacterized protein